MTDDEVGRWLTEDECGLFIANDRGHTASDGQIIKVLRALAEARMALVTLEWTRDRTDWDSYCSICGRAQRGPHEMDCIFATMPRPRET